MKTRFTIFLTIMALATAAQAGGVTVITEPDAPSPVRIVARELADYLERLYPNASGKKVRLIANLKEDESYQITATENEAVIAGGGPRGVVYGVYALLEKLGCGFDLSGDILPPARTEPLSFKDWPLADKPLVGERLVFNWHNFLSGCSTWNLADWKRWTEQSQKMGYNAIMVHAYGNNPMAGFTFHDTAKPVGYLSTTVKGRDWCTMHVNDVRRILGGEVFDRPVFGADAALVPDKQRVQAAQALMRDVFAHAAERGMGVVFAVDVDMPSANPQELVCLLPEAARFKAGGVWLPNPDTPEGDSFYSAQVGGLMRMYPDITTLVVWFRRNDTFWLNMKVSDLPPAWQKEWADEIARSPEAAKYSQAPGLFAIGKIVRAFERALEACGADQTRLAAGSWGFDFLSGADRFFPKDVSLIGLDTDVIDEKPKLGTAESRAPLREIGARRPVIPIIWAHHDDGHYIGRPYTPFSDFHSKLVDAKACGFGIIHWTTRPLDLYFASHARQVFEKTEDEPLRETCEHMAERWYGSANRTIMGGYLESWITGAPTFGRETTPWFVDCKLKDIPAVITACQTRIATLDKVPTAGLLPEQRQRLDYQRGLEQFIAAFYRAHGYLQDSQDKLKNGDIAGARALIAQCHPEEVIQQFAKFSAIGGITRGEQGLLVSLNTRWFSHIVRQRQALGLEPVRINFAATSHDRLAQARGLFTFHFGPHHELWETWGEEETAATIADLPFASDPAKNPSVPTAWSEVGRTGIFINKPFQLTIRPIMSHARLKAADLPPGDYRLHLLVLDPDSNAPARIFLEVKLADSPPDRVDVFQRAGDSNRMVDLTYPISLKSAGPLKVSLTPIKGGTVLCGAVLEPTASSVGAVRATETVSLAGDWRFEIADTNAAGFLKELPGKIKLSGTIDDARLGPPNTKVPTLEGPWRLSNYAGPAWYQRDIEIPADWEGRRVTLFLERCRWVTTVWLDDRCICSQDSLIAPHVYDLGTGIAPGKHRLTICVDNTDKIPLGKFVSAMRGVTWGNMNGIIGRIELASTPPVWLETVQVYPDVDRGCARVVVKIGNVTGKAGSGTLTAGTKSISAIWDEKGGRVEMEVDMSAAKLWDEFSPNLTELTVTLGEDRRTVRFGMRKFAKQGTQFTLNGRPVFLRGTLECSVFPLTGYPPTDVESWRKIYQIEKSYGLNFIRFHSWCPPEAAFTAADLEGIMVQAEGPASVKMTEKHEAREAFLTAEYQRIVDTYGNHPSFCLMALGNECRGSDAVLSGWVDMLIQRDPRRLYSSPAEWQKTKNRQWTEIGEGRGIKGPGTARDLSEIVAKDNRPVICHQVGQWVYWPDSREISKWTGVMALKNFEMVRDDLKKKNLFGLEPQFIESCGKFATLLYKEEIEVLLRTPGYGGFSLLDLHDYPTQGTALVGPLNAFWESKGFITPEGYRRFCNATVPLLRMPKRTYTSAETFEAKVQVAHYGAADLANTQPVWKVTDTKGSELATGRLQSVTAPAGKITELGVIQAALADIKTPGKFTVTVSLEGTQVANDWEIWVYPETPAPVPPADVVICKAWNDAKAGLAEGRKVVFFSGVTDAKHAMVGSFLPVFWSPVWFPDQKPNTMGLLCDPMHPLFALFPTEMHSNWQWYDLMQHSRLFVLDDMPADYLPLVQVIDNFARNHKLGVVFETKVGNGKLLVCGFDLQTPKSEPATRQFLASLHAYVGSNHFKPVYEMSFEKLEAIVL